MFKLFVPTGVVRVNDSFRCLIQPRWYGGEVDDSRVILSSVHEVFRHWVDQRKVPIAMIHWRIALHLGMQKSAEFTEYEMSIGELRACRAATEDIIKGRE